MNFVIDASSIMNLENAGEIENVCSLESCFLHVSPLILGECDAACTEKVITLSAEQRISLINEDEVPTEEFLTLLKKHGLGDGETEAIVIADKLGYGVCCDDKKARNLAIELLGNKAVIGSLRLIKWCVEENIKECNAAFAAYETMKLQGGFLPQLHKNFFCNAV